MPREQPHPVVRHLRRLAGDPSAPWTDAQLLGRFVADRDEAAFAALARRHGGLIRSACRPLLRHAEDVEDAVQATLLVLARRAASVRRRDALASWLYGVAHRVALNARKAAMRRQTHEGQPKPRAPEPPAAEAALRELQAILDEEVVRLPEKYRAPFVLCCLEGKGKAEAARELGWKEGTVSGRLARARRLLQARLARRGVALSAALCAAALGREPAAAAVSAAAARAVLASAAGREEAVSAAAAALAEGVIKAMFATKLKGGAALVLALTLLTAGAGLAAHQALSAWHPEGQEARPPEPPAAGRDGPKPGDERQVRTDRHGDPLPEGVLARMGSGRLRHGATIRTLVFSPDGKSLASAANDGLRVWDAATGKRRWRLDLDPEADWAIACDFSTTGITVASVGYAKEIVTCQVLDPATGKVRRRIELKEPTAFGTPAVSPGGKWIAVLHVNQNQHELRLYDTASGQETLRIPAQSLRDAAFAPDGKTIAVCDFSDTVRIHDATNGQIVRELKREGDKVCNLTLSPDGRFLASIPRNETDPPSNPEVSIWDLSTGKERYRLKTDPVLVVCATFSPDGRLVATGGHGRHVILWDLATGKEVRRLAAGYPVARLAFSPDGKVLATTVEERISLWEVATGQRLPASADPGFWIRDLHFAHDGKRLIGVARSPIAWDSATGREIHRFPFFPNMEDYPVLSPDESLIAVARPDGTIRLHDAATDKEVHVLRGHENYVWPDVLFSADGRRLISSSTDQTIRVWEVVTGRELLKLATNDKGIVRLATSPDGRWLAALTENRSAQGDYPVVIWDLTTGRAAQRFRPRRGQPHHLAFSPDSRLLAAAVTGQTRDEPGDVQVWDMVTGREYAEFVGHKTGRRCVAFSPDGRMLATGGEDRTMRLWELASGRQREQFNGHEGRIYAVAFSPDGRVLAASSPDAPVYLWDVAGRLEEVRALTRAELEQAWANLRSEDATTAFRAVRQLAKVPEQTVPLLRQQVRPVAPVDAKRLALLIADLDSERFEVRQQATTELEKLGEQAESALRKALEGQPTPEARRRLEQLIEKLTGPMTSSDLLRTLRAVEVLEHIGTAEARQVLESLTKGVPEARLTQEAKAALERLARPSAVAP